MPRVHTYTAAEAGLLVNSYLIEGESEVLVIDTGLLVSDIEALHARLAALRKPLSGIVVTHAHPDHFNGVFRLIQDREVPVYAAPSVAQVITEIADAKRAQWSPTYGDEWPSRTYYPNTVVPDGGSIPFEDVQITMHEIGPGESHADSFVRAVPADGKPVAFIGDLAFHGTHPYTADGHTTQWLAALDTLGTALSDATILYPGHGALADLRILADQRRYLLYYREVVHRLAEGRAALTESEVTELERHMREFLPDAPLTWMIGLGAGAVAEELAGRLSATAG
ncbi:MBL fold metallo-hydrolase [Nocardia brasiliensis]|uniref:MBL fold metallo-hydrolase n=1 Tax=Nocardia brasiliensis TaxID=37326 RepID=UPI003D8D18BE